MTPRQRKRLARAHAKGRPLLFIKFRSATTVFSASINTAFIEMLEGQRCAVEAIRDQIRATAIELVARPIVRAIVRDVVRAMR